MAGWSSRGVGGGKLKVSREPVNGALNATEAEARCNWKGLFGIGADLLIDA